jgi:hypothetical protein
MFSSGFSVILLISSYIIHCG